MKIALVCPASLVLNTISPATSLLAPLLSPISPPPYAPMATPLPPLTSLLVPPLTVEPDELKLT